MSLSEPPRSRTCLRRPRILLVDDDPGVIRGLWRLLRQLRPDFAVNTASCAAQAIAALSMHSYDVVLTDLHMPGGSGHSVLRALLESYPETARIVHSSQLESGDPSELGQLAHAVLAKPATESALLAAINLAAERAASEGRPSWCG